MRDDILREVQEILARMTLPELTTLIKLAADDIELRTMQEAGVREE